MGRDFRTLYTGVSFIQAVEGIGVALSVEKTNTYAAKFSIAGWFIGLAYYNWFSSSAVHVSLVGHIILVVVGMFAASVLIGLGVALIFAILTKLLTGRHDGTSDLYAWGAFISPVLAFFAAGWAIPVVARLM